MLCPICNGPTLVNDTSHNAEKNVIYRKRKCKECGHIFYTTCVETIEPNSHRLFRLNYRGVNT